MDAKRRKQETERQQQAMALPTQSVQ